MNDIEKDKMSRQNKWNKENLLSIQLSYSKNNPIYIALKNMEKEQSKNITQYIKESIESQLKTDGYL